jgi:iron complex outermembrane receptor protein
MRTTLVLAALLPLGAIAAEPAPTEDLEDSGPMDIVVTGTRDARSAAHLPLSITLIEGGRVALGGAKHQAEVLNQTPGAYIQRGSGGESLTAIRSPVLAGAGACGAFLVAEDSLPIRPVGFCNLNEMFEVNYQQAAGIEVLRGPGSALFGASAVHGIVNTITPDAGSVPAFFMGAETGSDSFKRISAGASRAPTENERWPALAAYGVASRAPGWRDASGVDEMKLNLLADSDLGGGKLKVRASGTVLNQETAGFIQGVDAYRDRTLSRSNPNPEAFRDASSARVAVHYDHPLEGDDRWQLAGLYRRSRMDFSQHFLIGKPFEHNAQTSYLLTGAWLKNARPFNARLAFDAESATTELTEFQPGPATDGAPAANAIRPAGFHYDYSVVSRTFGASASLEYAFSSEWRASIALRADTTGYEYDNHMLDGNTDQNGVSCGATGCLYSRPADRSDRFDNVSPRFTLSWDNGEHLAYFNASTGHRPPEMTELYRLQRQQSVAALDSEQLDSIEIGWKAGLGFLGWQLSAFDMDKRNVILRESNGFNVGNGATRHRGLEYEVYFFAPLPDERLLLKASGTYARHEYAFSRAVEGGETIVSGNDIDTAPRHVHSVEVRYPFDDAGYQAAVIWSYVGSYFLDASNSARYPGHDTASARFTWSPSRLPVALTLRVDNLFDTAYADRADFAFGNYRYFPARGRAAFLSIDYRSN